MTAVQVLVLIVALLVVGAALTAVWLRRRRAGGVRIANAPLGTGRPEDRP